MIKAYGQGLAFRIGGLITVDRYWGHRRRAYIITTYLGGPWETRMNEFIPSISVCLFAHLQPAPVL